MAHFIITDKGLALQTKVFAGDAAYEFTKIGIGDGFAASLDDYKTLNDLMQRKADVPISTVEDEGNGYCSVSGIISNDDITEPLYVREAGLYAADPDDGEVLIAATYYERPTVLDVASVGSIVKEVKFKIGIESAENVNMTVTPAGMITKATAAEMDSKVKAELIEKIESATSADAIKGLLINSIIPQGAASHNCFYRGNDLTEYFKSGEMSAAIASGNFDNIFIGDYIKKSVTVAGTEYKDVIWRVGDCDYNFGRGYANQDVHHVLMVPDTNLGNAQMNTTNTTAGGYQGSKMWKETIPQYASGIVNAFGADHVLEHQELLTNNMDPDANSACNNQWKGMAYTDWSKGTTGKDGHPWATVKANIFNSCMMFGSPLGSSFQVDYSCNKQIALFRFGMNFVKGQWCWLRDVATAGSFADAGGDGFAIAPSASNANGVRPYFLLH